MTVSKLRFDLAQQGLHCILKPYQAEVMRFLWQTGKPQDSRAVHQHIETADIPGASSRPSVINFLNHMVQEGFLDYEEKSTKGGYKRIYSLNEQSETERAFRLHVSMKFYDSLWEFGETYNLSESIMELRAKKRREDEG